MKRHDFLRSLLGLPLARYLPEVRDGSVPAIGTVPTRRLGRADVPVTILGLGGSHVGQAGSERAAHRLVETALAEGIRFFDTAESYGNGTSERWLGAALAGARRDVFLMTKTFDFPARTAEGSKRHLEGSLARLRTDRLDLWQLHSVRSIADVDRACARGGPMEYILSMRDQGVVRFVGVTGHADPAANLRTLDHWDRGLRFDAMQFPLNPIDAHQSSFQRALLPELAKRDIAVIAMKTTADAALLREKVCTNEECRRYAWSLPIATAVVGMETPEQIRQNARLARESVMMTEKEREVLLERIRPNASLSLEWYKR
ncbi:MAG TPA: aldo/keto reductase [Gemmatimonadales bacterium]|nr:aldo/keto reductase [Gemmatimonadales bacterium]